MRKAAKNGLNRVYPQNSKAPYCHFAEATAQSFKIQFLRLSLSSSANGAEPPTAWVSLCLSYAWPRSTPAGTPRSPGHQMANLFGLQSLCSCLSESGFLLSSQQLLMVVFSDGIPFLTVSLLFFFSSGPSHLWSPQSPSHIEGVGVAMENQVEQASLCLLLLVWRKQVTQPQFSHLTSGANRAHITR